MFDPDERVRLELEEFFRTAVIFEGKDLRVLRWSGPEDATALIRTSELHETARR